MWVRKRIDIGWRGLAGAAMDCARGGDVAPFEERIAALWGRAGRHPFVNLSVRSGFDSLLTTLAFEPGDEIAMSALTIPDMPNIVREHGLLPVPIDVEPESMNVRPEQVEAAISPRTRAVVVAHLFGGRVPLEPIAEVCRRRGVLLIEDCAQAFTGWDFTGSPQADVSMFSFGPIKTATALGGAVVFVRDDSLRRKMTEIHESWPRQSRISYLKKLFTFCLFKPLLSPAPYTLLIGTLRLLGCDHDALVTGSARSFEGGEFFSRIRCRPCPALERLVSHRVRTYDESRLARRTSSGRELLEAIPAGLAFGGQAANHSFWIFPVVSPAPEEWCRRLLNAGFDAARSSTSLGAVDPLPGRFETNPDIASNAMNAVIYLPAYPEMSTRSLGKLARLVKALCETCG